MADFSKMRTTLQAASEDIKTMNKNLVNSDKYAEGLIRNMADLASMSSVKDFQRAKRFLFKNNLGVLQF